MNTNVELQNLSNQEMKEINGGYCLYYWDYAKVVNINNIKKYHHERT